MALNSLIPVMTEGFGMGQPVSAMLLLIPAANHGPPHTVTHSHGSGCVPLSTLLLLMKFSTNSNMCNSLFGSDLTKVCSNAV